MKVYLIEKSDGSVLGEYEAVEWGEDYVTWQNGEGTMTTRCGSDLMFTDVAPGEKEVRAIEPDEPV
jgi:hypothetical protein